MDHDLPQVMATEFNAQCLIVTVHLINSMACSEITVYAISPVLFDEEQQHKPVFECIRCFVMADPSVFLLRMTSVHSVTFFVIVDKPGH